MTMTEIWQGCRYASAALKMVYFHHEILIVFFGLSNLIISVIKQGKEYYEILVVISHLWHSACIPGHWLSQYGKKRFLNLYKCILRMSAGKKIVDIKDEFLSAWTRPHEFWFQYFFKIILYHFYEIKHVNAIFYKITRA